MPLPIRRTPWRSLASLFVVVACGACNPDAGDETDAFDGAVGEDAASITCDPGAICTFSGTASLYTALYRIGVTPTSRGEILQTFVAPSSDVPDSLTLVLRHLRRYAIYALDAGGQPQAQPALHVGVFRPANPDAPLAPENPAEYLALGSTALASFGVGGTTTLTAFDPAGTAIALTPADGAHFTSGDRYAIHVWTDALPDNASATILVGVGALVSSTEEGAAFRRTVRRQAGTWGLARARPAGTNLVAMSLGTTPAATCTAPSQAFHLTGTLVPLTVPAGCVGLRVKAWGAGGGGAGQTFHTQTFGGGGGFASGELTVTPGETLHVLVGGGGGGYTLGHGAGGGGRSAVLRAGEDLLTAGGGGGAGGTNADGTGVGGAGGGLTGVNGANGTAGYVGGTGGSATAGGLGGASASGRPGANGARGTGGAAQGNDARAAGGFGGGGQGGGIFSVYDGGGGGGGGYWGGGGGGGGGGGTSGGGGGGGSSFVPAGGTTIAGVGRSAANQGDSDYEGTIGMGGLVDQSGRPGLVHVCWTDGTPGAPCATPVGGPTSFSFTGALAPYVVPAGCTNLTVKAWGAGGGGAGQTFFTSLVGGGGGYATGVLTVTPGETLQVLVGGGGGGYSLGHGAGGGGRSAVQRSGEDVLVAGGGGGAGGTNMDGSGVGGAGGGNTGEAGANGSAGYVGGTGGTQVGGGLGGASSSGRPGADGARGTGGAAQGNDPRAAGGFGGGGQGGGIYSVYDGGGGGGGGYWGGGGGGGGGGGTNGGGGGGGSSFVPAGGSTIAGSRQAAGNAADPDLPVGLARGGNADASGGNGFVLVSCPGP